MDDLNDPVEGCPCPMCAEAARELDALGWRTLRPPALYAPRDDDRIEPEDEGPGDVLDAFEAVVLPMPPRRVQALPVDEIYPWP